MSWREEPSVLSVGGKGDPVNRIRDCTSPDEQASQLQEATAEIAWHAEITNKVTGRNTKSMKNRDGGNRRVTPRENGKQPRGTIGVKHWALLGIMKPRPDKMVACLGSAVTAQSSTRRQIRNARLMTRKLPRMCSHRGEMRREK